MPASYTGSARCPRAQPVCEYRSADPTNSIPVNVGISEGAAGVLAPKGASGESTPSKGVELLAAWVARWIGTVEIAPTRPSDEKPEGETIRGGGGVRTAAGRVAGCEIRTK